MPAPLFAALAAQQAAAAAAAAAALTAAAGTAAGAIGAGALGAGAAGAGALAAGAGAAPAAAGGLAEIGGMMPQMGSAAQMAEGAKIAAASMPDALAAGVPQATGTELMSPGLMQAQAANAAEAFQPGLSAATTAEAPWYEGLQEKVSSFMGMGEDQTDSESFFSQQQLQERASRLADTLGGVTDIQPLGRPYSGAPIQANIGPGQQNLAQLLQMMAAQRGR